MIFYIFTCLSAHHSHNHWLVNRQSAGVLATPVVPQCLSSVQRSVCVLVEMRSTEHFEDCVSVSNKSSESVDSVLYDPTYSEHHGQSNYTSECDSPPASSSGLHLSDDADSMLSETKLGPRSPTVKSIKMYSLSANNSPYLGRKNLVSESGTINWDADDDWIQQYDKMLRMTNCTQRKRACGCLLKRSSEINYQSVLSSPQHFRRGTVLRICLSFAFSACPPMACTNLHCGHTGVCIYTTRTCTSTLHLSLLCSLSIPFLLSLFSGVLQCLFLLYLSLHTHTSLPRFWNRRCCCSQTTSHTVALICVGHSVCLHSGTSPPFCGCTHERFLWGRVHFSSFRLLAGVTRGHSASPANSAASFTRIASHHTR